MKQLCKKCQQPLTRFYLREQGHHKLCQTQTEPAKEPKWPSLPPKHPLVRLTEHQSLATQNLPQNTLGNFAKGVTNSVWHAINHDYQQSQEKKKSPLHYLASYALAETISQKHRHVYRAVSLRTPAVLPLAFPHTDYDVIYLDETNKIIHCLEVKLRPATKEEKNQLWVPDDGYNMMWLDGEKWTDGIEQIKRQFLVMEKHIHLYPGVLRDKLQYDITPEWRIQISVHYFGNLGLGNKPTIRCLDAQCKYFPLYNYPLNNEVRTFNQLRVLIDDYYHEVTPLPSTLKHITKKDKE